jgi:tRNA1Val (adenine37-N6)-methyltransferase
VQEYAKFADRKYDLIVSNPPFFTGGTFSHNQDRNSVRHTIKLPHGDLLTAARKLLTDQGRLAVILPYIEGLRFQEMALTYNLYCRRITEVLPRAEKNIERLLMEFELNPGEIQKDELVIREAGENNWSAPYVALTSPFYLFMD